jgi:copper chaperone CopZ
MRHLFLAIAAVTTLAFGLNSAHAGKVELSGTHLCCMQCKNIAKAILAKVDGVSDVAVDKTVAFTTKDDKGTTAALKALADAGFTGTAKDDGKEVKVDLPSPKAGDKADTVTVKSVHVCCMRCKEAIGKLFPDGKIEYGKPADGTKATDVKITGKDLDKAEVLKKFRDAGFNGTVE